MVLKLVHKLLSIGHQEKVKLSESLLQILESLQTKKKILEIYTKIRNIYRCQTLVFPTKQHLYKILYTVRYTQELLKCRKNQQFQSNKLIHIIQFLQCSKKLSTQLEQQVAQTSDQKFLIAIRTEKKIIKYKLLFLNFRNIAITYSCITILHITTYVTLNQTYIHMNNNKLDNKHCKIFTTIIKNHNKYESLSTQQILIIRIQQTSQKLLNHQKTPNS
eukprot:TRINITY_DN19549_c1_g1_i1.p1 TRINITY_DN19549_c1_g1~~TRINITY_DN19549_c1_g1_i1.p1  ORF type:complete len:218 (-),score=-30.23 TRINITY_DN19549_c1_g1_i1:415-1068(-)